MKKISAPKESVKTTDLYSNTKPKRAPFKIEVTAMLFVERGTKGMNSPEANCEYGESCLHTSVSTLYNDHGISFKRQSESFINRAGTKSTFTRYSILTIDDELRAKKLVEDFRVRRGLPPFIWEEAA